MHAAAVYARVVCLTKESASYELQENKLSLIATPPLQQVLTPPLKGFLKRGQAERGARVRHAALWTVD